MRARLRRDGFVPELVGECFALVREAARVPQASALQVAAYGGWRCWKAGWLKWHRGGQDIRCHTAGVHGSACRLSGACDHGQRLSASRDAEKMAPLYRFLG